MNDKLKLTFSTHKKILLKGGNILKANNSKACHNSLIKKAMENPATSQELLAEYLPKEHKSLIDLSMLKAKKETSVEESLKTKLSDMVVSVRMHTKNKEGPQNTFIYVLPEHQPYSDHQIALQLLKYSLLLIERHASKRNKLPLVLPLVIYDNEKKCTTSKNIFNLFAYPQLTRKMITEDYLLIDLQSIPDDDIDYEKHLGFLFYVIKHIHEQDMLAMLKEAIARCRKAITLDKGQNYILIKLILWYASFKVSEEKKQLLEQLIADNLPKEDTNNIMRTIADSYIEEGFNKGMIQGFEKGISISKLEIAKAMLLDGDSIAKVAKITGLSTQEIQRLNKS